LGISKKTLRVNEIDIRVGINCSFKHLKGQDKWLWLDLDKSMKCGFYIEL